MHVAVVAHKLRTIFAMIQEFHVNMYAPVQNEYLAPECDLEDEQQFEGRLVSPRGSSGQKCSHKRAIIACAAALSVAVGLLGIWKFHPQSFGKSANLEAITSLASVTELSCDTSNPVTSSEIAAQESLKDSNGWDSFYIGAATNNN